MGTKNLARLYVGVCKAEVCKGIMYGNCKVHEQQVDGSPHFDQFYRLYKLGCHFNMSFSMETEKENKLSFFDVEVIHE